MGSRGLSYAPLSAEILASELAGETAILDEDLRLALHPARFMIRDLKKKRL
jgi:tRNA 5-methylaminomethyl-2-thiouridine biosynthesis bifunctional protein